MSRKPNSQEVEKGIADSTAAVETRRLLPSLNDCRAIDPNGTLIGDPKGRWEYRFSKPQDESKSDAIARRMFEATEPWRRSEIARGGNQNAAIPTALVRDERGMPRPVPAHMADRIARKRGLRPVIRYGGIKVLADSEGYLWRDYGKPPLEPVGHTHLGRPWPHQAATCRGCLAGR